MPASRLLKERSISSNSGDVDRDVLAELLVSGLEAFEDGCELLSDDVSNEELLSVPLVLVLSVLDLPDGELAKDTEDSLVVVSGLEAFEDGCELLSDDVSKEELLSVPLVLVLSVLDLPDGELAKDTEDLLVVVSDTGCELAG